MIPTSSNLPLPRSLHILTPATPPLRHYSTTKLASFPPGSISWHLLWTHFESGQELESVDDVTGENVSSLGEKRTIVRVAAEPDSAQIGMRLDRWAYVKESMGR